MSVAWIVAASAACTTEIAAPEGPDQPVTVEDGPDAGEATTGGGDEEPDPPDPAECDDPDDCADGEHCDEYGTCTMTCKGEGECLTGQACNLGLQICEVDPGCPAAHCTDAFGEDVCAGETGYIPCGTQEGERPCTCSSSGTWTSCAPGCV